MSTNRNKRQQIAIYYLAMGYKPSEVANKLNVRRETISRWQRDDEFERELKLARMDFLKELLFKEIRFLDLAQQQFDAFLQNPDVQPYHKAKLALHFMKQYSGKTTLERKLVYKMHEVVFGGEFHI
tara:strand:- start:160 stop:537 length:378 start_codon:yes stop_codon:yes gene_type:complete